MPCRICTEPVLIVTAPYLRLLGPMATPSMETLCSTHHNDFCEESADALLFGSREQYLARLETFVQTRSVQ